MKNNRECCKIDAVVTVDTKGQIVLPKDLRNRAGIKPNDKLAMIGVEQAGCICCIVMIKADALESSIKERLGPIFKQTFASGGET
jgi:antitoxin PrlF